jgi:hypothetical protein
VTFTSLTHGGYLYLLGSQGAADLNVNGPYTLGPVIEANALSGFGASFDANVPGNVSSFGKFDLSLNNSDGFHGSATSISFTLTDTGRSFPSRLSARWPCSAIGWSRPNGSSATAKTERSPALTGTRRSENASAAPAQDRTNRRIWVIGDHGNERPFSAAPAIFCTGGSVPRAILMLWPRWAPDRLGRC